LCRAPNEPVNEAIEQFYGRLLAVLDRPALRDGRWQLLHCAPAWDGNWTSNNYVAYAWRGVDGDRLIMAVNYSPVRSQCYARLPFEDLGGREWRLDDLLGQATHDRAGDDLQARGLYLDEPPWRAAAFSMTAV
jgi:hypothetical protein